MKSVSLVAAGALVVAAGCAPQAASAEPVAAAETPGVAPVSASASQSDAFLALSVADIKARVRKADATKMSKRDLQCRNFVKSTLPSWWGPSGHTVVCTSGTTKGYDFWFDGVAVLTVNSTLGPEQWAQSVPWAVSKVGASERIPLSKAPSLCRQTIKAYAGLAKKAGNYRIRCVPTITWKVPDKSAKDMSVLGYVTYAKRDIAILETRDVNSMKIVTSHELGHAVSFSPKAAGLQKEMAKYAKRSSFTAGPYIGMPAEIWAESFARYYERQPKVASVQPRRLSDAKVDALLKKYGLPRR